MLSFRYRVRFKDVWHTGSGQRSVGIDRLIRRAGGVAGVPVLPGSLLRGTLRHRCEQLASVIGLEFTTPHTLDTETARKIVDFFRPLAELPASDLVDRLFGTRYEGECLYVGNALPEGLADGDGRGNRAAGVPSYVQRTGVRTRTAIDRATGTVQRGHLFSTELVGPLSLTGLIRAYHRPELLTRDEKAFPVEYSFLLTALLSIDRLGGDKTVGVGYCSVEVVGRLKFDGQEFELAEALEPLKEKDLRLWVELLRESGT